MSKLFVLSIGINEYQPPADPLKYCMNDAELFHKAYSGFNYEYNKLLVNSEATQQNILKALTDIERARDDDYVIIFFAGHGYTTHKKNQEKISSENSYIIAYDTDPKYLDDTGIKYAELNKRILKLNAKSVMLILDCCHSGSALRAGDPELEGISSREMIEFFSRNEGNAIITSCDADEKAIERDHLQHGCFTYYFNQILSNSEKNGLPLKSTIEELRSLIKNELSGIGLKQTPQYRADSDNFLIPKMNKNPTATTKTLDLSEIPSGSDPVIENLDEYTSKVFTANNSLFVVNEELSKKIQSAYDFISERTAPPHNSDKKDVLSTYAECRAEIKPIISIIDNSLVLFSKNEISQLIPTIKLLFELEKLASSRAGLVAMVEMPLTILSEIMFSAIATAYTIRSADIFKIFFENRFFKSTGYVGPLVYYNKCWYPEIFHRDCKKFFDYFFQEKGSASKIVDKQKKSSFLEALYLIDCLANSSLDHVSYPIAFAYNNNVAIEVISKIYHSDYRSFLESAFDLSIEEIIHKIFKRQCEIAKNRTFLDGVIIMTHNHEVEIHQLCTHLKIKSPVQTSAAS